MRSTETVRFFGTTLGIAGALLGLGRAIVGAQRNDYVGIAVYAIVGALTGGLFGVSFGVILGSLGWNLKGTRDEPPVSDRIQLASAGKTLKSIIIRTITGFIIGAVIGALFGWLFLKQANIALGNAIRGNDRDAQGTLIGIMVLGSIVGTAVGLFNGLVRRRPRTGHHSPSEE